MSKVFTTILMLGVLSSLAMSQTSMMFYNGEYGSDVDPGAVWDWGFTNTPGPIDETGYTPGTDAFVWSTYDNGGYQGVLWWYNYTVDLSSVWSTDSIYFKLRAPDGLAESDTNLNVLLYDSRADTWENTMKYELTNFQDLNDGEWHQFVVALSDLEDHPDVTGAPLDRAAIYAISFEYFDTGVASTFYIDKVWIGTPEVPIELTIFNGQAVSRNIGFEAWGFNNNDLEFAEGEGYQVGTNAILWETSNWDWQGKGFWFDPQDFTDSWDSDSLKIKIKAPAAINDFAFVWYDWSDYTARYVLSEVAWDGEWHVFSIPLYDFSMDEGFDVSSIYYFSIEANEATIPERVLLDDIWVGDPDIIIDLDPPLPPVSISVSDDEGTPYINYISWPDNEAETGETYDVYASKNLITDLSSTDVFMVADNVEDGVNVAIHRIYHPITEGDETFFYAVSATDVNGNPSETFTTSESFTNVGEARSIIHYGMPPNFVADGFFDEWAGIVPFNIHPDRSLIETGSFADSLDYSLNCYLAMDSDNLYVAFDVLDDVFSWQESNSSDWWDDESIEFFIGLYEIAGSESHHHGWTRGSEPDFRITFRPDRYTFDAWPSEDSILVSAEDYSFDSGGASNYYIEAKIPLANLTSLAGDSAFTPVEGMKIPLEIQINDNDQVDGGGETIKRMQFGVNSGDSPWNSAPDIWTFTWIGLPMVVGIENNPQTVSSYALGNAYPNPFNPLTTIEYSTAKTGNVKIEVYNSLGQYVATLVNEHQLAGNHKVNFDGSQLSSGLYFYKIQSKNYTNTKKMLLVK